MVDLIFAVTEAVPYLMMISNDAGVHELLGLVLKGNFVALGVKLLRRYIRVSHGTHENQYLKMDQCSSRNTNLNKAGAVKLLLVSNLASFAYPE